MAGKGKKKKDKSTAEKIMDNKCPQKDKDGNCIEPGVYGDSEPIGGGG